MGTALSIARGQTNCVTMASHRRARVILAQLKAAGVDPTLVQMTNQLQSCEDKLHALIGNQSCAQQLIRLAMSQSAADGSIVLGEGTDTDLDTAMHILRPLKTSFPLVSWADLIQMARAVAIRKCGGPRVPMRYGRVDAEVVKRGRTRMNGLEKQTAHTQLRETMTKLDSQSEAIAMLADRGLSVEHQLVLAGDIDNKFEKSGKPNLLAITDHPQFRPQHELYTKNEVALVRDYAWAHAEHSEVGATFSPISGLQIR